MPYILCPWEIENRSVGYLFILKSPFSSPARFLSSPQVFKKPMDKPATKKSPVSVDTANLQIPLSDVEMLSAQSTEGSKAMDTQTPRTPVVVKQVGTG